jgi:hypothetical protein
MRRFILVATLAAASVVAANASAAPTKSSLAEQIAAAHVATAKYANGLDRARADGYVILTKMIPGMGYHFINPKVTGFDVKKPPILVYLKHNGTWQLGALEWVFPQKPATPPLPGAKYGFFPAACHYKDGTFVPAAAQSGCPTTAPGSGAAFNLWHPPLVTMHVWLWYANPAGLFSGMNPFSVPFNRG